MSCPVGTEKLDPLGICGVVIDDKVEVQSLVGEGAFGFVYRGVHRGFDAPVAIKCLKLAPHYDREAQDRLVAKLREEGRTMMRLSQRTSAIVQAHDLGDRVLLEDRERAHGPHADVVVVQEQARLPARGTGERHLSLRRIGAGRWPDSLTGDENREPGEGTPRDHVMESWRGIPVAFRAPGASAHENERASDQQDQAAGQQARVDLWRPVGLRGGADLLPVLKGGDARGSRGCEGGEEHGSREQGGELGFLHWAGSWHDGPTVTIETMPPIDPADASDLTPRTAT